ncbi:uncharacterized protein IL334_004793 [Kwoniella shivajii]|uniref:Uncharacterized protein n=1 Tax=Kwoniella shivajii TaxID=564305 RepID=A0ABZ1D383_9TREE|nr:hypothetical protein IL334_004793 [Kwoniella shivajii]
MLCEPTSRPQSPFMHKSPRSHSHTQSPIFSPTMPLTFSRQVYGTFSTSPITSISGPSQPTPIHHSHSVPSTPITLTSSSSCTTITTNNSRPPVITHSQSHRITRPKSMKKPSGSTSQKQKNVQMSLEVKVEKAKGFHAFFVPLCKNLPPAPPCSPVGSHGNGNGILKQRDDDNQNNGVSGFGGNGNDNASGIGNLTEMDYFGQWNKRKENDQWVEDVTTSLSEGMDIDAN